MTKIRLIAFDADDTLWHNEIHYQETINQVVRILANYAPAEQTRQRLDDIEIRNLSLYGFGAKSFILSIIEMAIDISLQQVRADEIEQILALGKEMITAETDLLEGVEETLAEVSKTYPLMVITKGDLLDQEAKLARSGLAGYFQYFETVTEKNSETYRRILERQNIAANEFLMVGNALKSDILPVIQLGGYAVYIPYEMTWSLEMKVEGEMDAEKFYTIQNVRELPGLLTRIVD
jgi:putative hydrolase of the HAD superfamily